MPKTSVPATGEAMPAAKINRRNLVKGAGIAAAATVASTVTASALPEGSLLPGLIAAHKSAVVAFHAAIDKEEDAERHYLENCQKRMVLVREGHWREVQTEYSTPWWVLRDEAHKEIAAEYDGLRASVPRVAVSASMREYATAELNKCQRGAYRRLVPVINQIAEEQQRLGLLDAWQEREEACDAEEEASLALLSYPCQTLAECREKVAYIRTGRSIGDDIANGHPPYLNAFLNSFLVEA